jgi:hypothetical protein
MPDAKITALTTLANLSDDDVFAVVDDPGGTPVTKKVTVAVTRSIQAFSADAIAKALSFTKSRNATVGSHTIVQSGDALGAINFYGDNGTTANLAAAITAEVDGTPGAGTDMPGRIVFYTSPDGTATPTEWMRITNAGQVGIGTTPAAGVRLHVYDAAATTVIFDGQAAHATYTGGIFQAIATRAATTAYSFFFGYSNAGGDTEINLRGDGTILSDIAATTPADYAEYFETLSGKAIEPGTVVCLDKGGKVRPAKKDDRILGVIRPVGASAVVANSHWSRWQDKYLKTPYGAYVLDGKGDRTLNPKYNPKKEYKNRDERPEWIIVGLLGQIPINKGQPVKDSWTYMYDVTPDVQMWYVG